MGGNAGQGFPEGGSLSPPLKDKGSIVDTELQVEMQVEDTLMCDAGGQSITKCRMSDANSVEFSVDTQKVGMGNESRYEELVQEEPKLEARNKARGGPGFVNLEHPQLEFVDGAALNAMAGHEPMEIGTAASKAPEQAIPASLPMEQESIVQDFDSAEYGGFQAAHAKTAEAYVENTLTTDHSSQRPSLAATDGWLRIKIPEHFKRVKAQLYSMKSLEGMQSASQAIPGQSASHFGATRKGAKIKLNFTSKRRAKDRGSGGPSPSSAIPRGTPRKSRTWDGGLDDETTEELPTTPVDSEEELVLLTSPPEEEGAAMDQQVDGAAANEWSNVPVSGAAPLATGEWTDPAPGCDITRSRGRGRARGRARGRSGRGSARGRRRR